MTALTEFRYLAPTFGYETPDSSIITGYRDAAAQVTGFQVRGLRGSELGHHLIKCDDVESFPPLSRSPLPAPTGLLIYSESFKACVIGVTFLDYDSLSSDAYGRAVPGQRRVLIDFRPIQREALKM